MNNNVEVNNRNTIPRQEPISNLIINPSIIQEFRVHTKLRRGDRNKNYPKMLNIYEVELPKALIAQTLNNNEIIPTKI